MKSPNILTVESVVGGSKEVTTEVDGEWVPKRPCGFRSIQERFRAAWLVFKGEADALIWKGQ